MRPAIEVAQADRELLIELLELDDEQADLVRRSLAFTAETEALARHREADRLALVAEIVKDLRKVGDDAVMKALFKTAANYIEAKFGGGRHGDR